MPDYRCVFYSNSYKVYQYFLYEVDKDCHTEAHYTIQIKYFDNLVDSFETIQRSFSKPLIEINGDTLILKSNNDNFFNSYNEFYRKYFKNNFIGDWKESVWIDSFPVLKNNLITFE